MQAIKDLYEQVVVRLATPYSTGTGFYLRAFNLVVTSEYVVRDNREVIVQGLDLERQMIPVVFTDFQYDLAFLQPQQAFELPDIHLAEDASLAVGDPVLAIGHPFGLPFTAAESQVKALDYLQEEQAFIEINAHLAPGNGGGPVVNQAGEVVGVNSFLIRKDDQIDYALPVERLRALIDVFESQGRVPGVRCLHCDQLAFATAPTATECPHCQEKISYPFQLPVYTPTGIPSTIEHLISETGHRAPLARRGPNTWEIKEGSARVHISYYEKNGLIIGDAYLCELPPQDEKPLLEYLLKQNYEIEGLTFSIRNQTVVLSLLIYDRYFNENTGSKLFRHLFEKADHHDNILVEMFGASWRKEEDR